MMKKIYWNNIFTVQKRSLCLLVKKSGKLSDSGEPQFVDTALLGIVIILRREKFFIEMLIRKVF